MQEAIYRARITRAGHTHPGPRTVHDVPPETEIEIFGREPTRPKDLPGWRGPATVVNNNNPEAIVYRMGGALNDAPLHLIRPTPKQVTLFMEALFGEAAERGIFLSWEESLRGLARVRELAAGLSPGKHLVVGVLVGPSGNETLVGGTPELVMRDLKLVQGYCLEHLGLSFLGGFRVWNSVRKLPAVYAAGYGLLMSWPTGAPEDFLMRTVDSGRPLEVSKVVQTSSWEAFSGVRFFTYVQNLLHENESKLQQEMSSEGDGEESTLYPHSTTTEEAATSSGEGTGATTVYPPGTSSASTLYPPVSSSDIPPASSSE